MQSMAEDTNGNGRKGSAPNNHSVVSATQTPGKLSRTPLLKARGATPMRRYHRHPRSSFKSPVLATAETTSPAKPRDLQEAVKRVAAECTKAAEEIQELQKEYSVDELQTYIDLFHEYNEVKDTTQTVLGRLANVRGITVKQLHEEYGLSTND